MAPPVSIVVPVHNGRAFVTEAVSAALAQTHPSVEVVVWDDGSTDGSLDVARDAAGGDGRARFFRSERRRGLTATLNLAVAETTGTYVGSADADDRLHPGAVAATAAALDRSPGVGLAYTRHREIDAAGLPGRVGPRAEVPFDPNRLLIDFMVFHFRLFRRSLFDRLGGFDESYACAQDYDFVLRASEAARVERVPEVLYDYRLHGGSVSQTRAAEQLACSRRAVESALRRRGADRAFALRVDDLERFSLRRRG